MFYCSSFDKNIMPNYLILFLIYSIEHTVQNYTAINTYLNNHNK